MDDGLKGAECADSAARLPLSALVPTANASTEIITPVHIFCLQNQIRDMGHNLGVSCQDYMLPDTLLQVLQLSDMKAMLENSIATLQRMLDRQEIRSDINRNPSKEPPNKKQRIIQKFQTPTPFRRLILTDKILDIPAECKAKCEARRKPKIDVAIEDEILGGRVNYSPRYFISWLGNFILYCARQLPGTKGRISRNFLKGQFVYYHGKAGKTSRMLGTYTDSVITMPQLIKAVQAAWPNDLTDEVIKQLKILDQIGVMYLLVWWIWWKTAGDPAAPATTATGDHHRMELDPPGMESSRSRTKPRRSRAAVAAATSAAAVAKAASTEPRRRRAKAATPPPPTLAGHQVVAAAAVAGLLLRRCLLLLPLLRRGWRRRAAERG